MVIAAAIVLALNGGGGLVAFTFLAYAGTALTVLPRLLRGGAGPFTSVLLVIRGVVAGGATLALLIGAVVVLIVNH